MKNKYSHVYSNQSIGRIQNIKKIQPKVIKNNFYETHSDYEISDHQIMFKKRKINMLVEPVVNRK